MVNGGLRSLHFEILALHSFSTFRRNLPVVTALAVGGAAGLWQLSPWRSEGVVGRVIFIIAVAGLAGLVVERGVRLWNNQQSRYRLVQSTELLRGSYLDRIVELGRKVMGDGHAGVDTLRARLSRCPAGIVVLVRRPHKLRIRESIVGYIACWTISESATARFMTGEYTSGLDLTEADIVVEHPGAAYITMLLGTDEAAHYKILRVAAAHLADLFAPDDGPRLLLARAATGEGERIMRRHIGMTPLSLPGSVVWAVERDQLRRVLDRYVR